MKVQITIRGRQYTLRSDEDEDLRAIAAYVDGKMAEIAARGARLDEYTLAMLAALNIASEFERFRRDVEEQLQSMERDVASTAALIEAALPEPKTTRDSPMGVSDATEVASTEEVG